MQLTVASWDDRVFPIELDDNETLSTLQAILEAESNTPAAQQQLVHNGRPLPASASGQTLSALGIANGDVLMLLPAQPQGAQQQQPQQQRQGGQQQPQQQDPHMALAADGAAVAPAAFIQAVKAQPELLAQIAVSNPPLAAAIRNEDVEALQVCEGCMHSRPIRSCKTGVLVAQALSVCQVVGHLLVCLRRSRQDACLLMRPHLRVRVLHHTPAHNVPALTTPLLSRLAALLLREQQSRNTTDPVA